MTGIHPAFRKYTSSWATNLKSALGARIDAEFLWRQEHPLRVSQPRLLRLFAEAAGVLGRAARRRRRRDRHRLVGIFEQGVVELRFEFHAVVNGR